MPYFIFKTDNQKIETIRVILDGTEPAVFDDYSNELHCGFEGYKEIDLLHQSGKSYREIIRGIHKLSETEIGI